MTIKEAIEEFMMHITFIDPKAKKTIQSYTNNLRQYNEYLESKNVTIVKDITTTHIVDYLYQKSLTLTKKTINQHQSAMNSFHRWLNDKYDQPNPCKNIKLTGKGKTLPIYIKSNDIERLQQSFNDTPIDIFHRAIIDLLYGCGLRISECVTASLQHINFEHKTITITGKGNKQRVIPIPTSTMASLYQYTQKVRPGWNKNNLSNLFVNRFGRHTTSESVEKMVKERCKLLNIDERITPHKFRHSYATHLYQHGADLRAVQELLGHASIETTEIYTHLEKENIFSMYNQFHNKDDQKD